MTTSNKLQIQSLIKSLVSVSSLSSQEDIIRARGFITELYLKFSLPSETLFTPCSNSIVDYSCPERAKFLELVDNSV